MTIWGINALNHDASIAVVANKELKFWARASQYSGIPGDDKLPSRLISEAINHSQYRGPEVISWYERPLLKKTRQLWAGQYEEAFNMSVMPSRYLKQNNLGYAKVKYKGHHESHAAAGFFTSPFTQAAIIVLDAIGEWESASIWLGSGTHLTKMWSASYPNSLGLFYSAFTKLIGYKPLAEEHLLQRDSDLGDPNRYYLDVKGYFTKPMHLKYNLHRGVYNWPHPITCDQDRYDIAAAVQRVFEDNASWVNVYAELLTGQRNLVYMGGCAMNSKYNTKMVEHWDGVWSLPVPGDASSAIGAALLEAKCRIEWKGTLAKHIEIK
jgi:carbamoyltransferase